MFSAFIHIKEGFMTWDSTLTILASGGKQKLMSFDMMGMERDIYLGLMLPCQSSDKIQFLWISSVRLGNQLIELVIACWSSNEAHFRFYSYRIEVNIMVLYSPQNKILQQFKFNLLL